VRCGYFYGIQALIITYPDLGNELSASYLVIDVTYCASCERYVKCELRGDRDKLPYYCELYRRPRRLETRDTYNLSA